MSPHRNENKCRLAEISSYIAQIFRDCNWNTTYLDNPRYTSHMTLTYPVVQCTHICTYICPYFELLTSIVVTYTSSIVHRKKPSPGLHVSHVGAQLAMDILQPQKTGWRKKGFVLEAKIQWRNWLGCQRQKKKRSWWLKHKKKNRWCGARLVFLVDVLKIGDAA